MRKALQILLLPAVFLASTWAADYKAIEPAEGYAHDRWQTQPADLVQQFRAYTVSFDGRDDNDGDGDADCWGLPEWVAYEIRSHDGLAKGPKRPGTWLTDRELAKQGIAPKDDTYRNSGYDRGHMCMKQIAWRLGAAADWNTHTVLNACPQLHKFNAGIWLDMEFKTQNWADEYGAVWVICGPVIRDRKPIQFIGDEGEMRIPVPDGFFKIVAKQDEDGVDVVAFLYPHEDIQKVDGRYDHRRYVVPVDQIEEATGLDFLTVLPDEMEEKLESETDTEDWEWGNGVRPNTRRRGTALTPSDVTYYVSTGTSKKFHKPTCRYAKPLEEPGVLKFESREDALAAGKEPCKVCKP
ncbi:MAG: DNA/RNA non-specific endonuclease [Lentisphaerae bacterium]|jgi:endonuclease G, mitochondrial|nr:DNA/RNA non-specific endonuclease [Lentisphaerota bacterium]MBT7060693.1 DNA/RNA non-specific endonuclease [Lentisphaerota bacterium]